MSLPPSNLGKSLSTAPSASHSPTPSNSASTPNFESSRRTVASGHPQSHSSAPRKGQGSRKQHRNQSKPAARVDDYDAMAEMRALRNASSRRGQTSITHLLDYSLPPRPHNVHGHSYHNRSYRRNPSSGLGSGYHAMDKARYVHANYRFVVLPNGDYKAQASDSDEHLEWDNVMQILASAESQASSCPICLSEPVAPRMARCGHIFCLPCLLRFMNIPEDNGTGVERKVRCKKCPICEDSIYISEVRPVRFYAGQESPLPRPGDDVVLRLMMRRGASTLALPKEEAVDVLNSGDTVPWHFAANVLDYARIMKGTAEYMRQEYDREVDDLGRQEKEDEMMFHEDGEWTQKAVRSIQSAKEKLGELQSVGEALSSKPAGGTSRRDPKVPEQEFFFYTSPPHLYLSPLDIRILKTKYGSFEMFPSTLLPRVEHISTGHVLDDAMRKRAKYLGHLPRGCLVSFLECDWTDIVPVEILETFKEEIERRRKRNRDKAVQEERERQQAERIEAAAIRGSRRNMGAMDDDVIIRYGNSASENAVDMNDFLPLGSEASTPPNPRRGFLELANLSTSPSTSRTVWGTQAISTAPEMEHTHVQQDVDDGWLKPDHLLDLTGADEVALQLEALGVEAAIPSPAPSGGGGGGKGKKKKQKITLMSTGGRRGN